MSTVNYLKRPPCDIPAETRDIGSLVQLVAGPLGVELVVPQLGVPLRRDGGQVRTGRHPHHRQHHRHHKGTLHDHINALQRSTCLV